MSSKKSWLYLTAQCSSPYFTNFPKTLEKHYLAPIGSRSQCSSSHSPPHTPANFDDSGKKWRPLDSSTMMGDCLEIFQTISKKCPKVQLFQKEISSFTLRCQESCTFTAPSMVREPSLSMFHHTRGSNLSQESCETGTVHKQKHPSHKILKKKQEKHLLGLNHQLTFHSHVDQLKIHLQWQ